MKAAKVPATATSIVIRQPAGQDLEFVRRDDQWLLLTPEEQPVIKERLDPLIRMSVIPIDNAYTASEVDLVAAGLDNPLARITIDGNTIALGHEDSNGDRRYAMQNDSVYFVPEWILSLIQGGPSAFITTAEDQ